MPWLVGAAVIAVFWVVEASLHTYLFSGGNFMRDLLRPGPHELWMRVVITVEIIVVAALWESQNRAHCRTEQLQEENEKRLRALMAHLAYGEHEDRRDLSRRLHDDVGQSLSAARLFMSAAQQGGEYETTCVSVKRILDRAVIDCREIAEELSPPSLDEYGLNTALEALGQRLTIRTGVSVDIGPLSPAELSREVTLACYHVLAEVVTSATQQDAKTVRVLSRTAAGSLAIEVRWDSGGSPDLTFARERLLEVDGELTHRTDDGRTTVTLHAPVGTPVHTGH